MERYPLDRVARDFGARLVGDALDEVAPESRRIRTAGSEELRYDALIVAVGARTAPPFASGITFGEPGARDALQGLLSDLEGGYVKRVAFVVPGGTSWPLPLYELALMTAAEVWGMGIDDAGLTFVSPERAPLHLFGSAGSGAVAGLLEEARIRFIGDSHAKLDGRTLTLAPSHRTLEVQRVVTLPLLSGPGTPGLPVDRDGFIPVDDHGLVEGLTDVYAAGDATTFPVKQGGIATQQADAAARAIAARAGAPVSPDPMRPVLRGMLLTGGAKQYLRHAITEGAGEGEVATRALWWPPHKVAGHYLAPYLFGRQEAEILGLPDDPHVSVTLSVPRGQPPGRIELLASEPE